MADDGEELDKICTILDKLTLDALHLMEEHIQTKIAIENSMIGGELHLAKSRYILGHNSVCGLQLPTENHEIEATVTIQDEESDEFFDTKLKHIEVVKNENRSDPLKWFGYLVPQDLIRAQNIFKQTLNWIIQAANLQIRLQETYSTIDSLEELKNELKQ